MGLGVIFNGNTNFFSESIGLTFTYKVFSIDNNSSQGQQMFKDLFNLHGLPQILAWVNNYISHSMWDVINFEIGLEWVITHCFM